MATLRARHRTERTWKARGVNLKSISQTAVFGKVADATSPIYIILIDNQLSNEAQTNSFQGVITQTTSAEEITTYWIGQTVVNVHSIRPYGAVNVSLDTLNSSSITYAEAQTDNRYFNEGMRRGLDNGGAFVAIVTDYICLTPADLFAAISELTTTNVMMERPFGWVINQNCYAAGGLLSEEVGFEQAIASWKEAIIAAGKTWGR